MYLSDDIWLLFLAMQSLCRTYLEIMSSNMYQLCILQHISVYY